MNKTSLLAVSKVVSVLLLLMGFLFSLTGVLGLLGTGTVSLGSSLAGSIGKGGIEYPMTYGIFGGLLILGLGLFEMALGFGLFQLKKWVPTYLIIFAVINFISSLGNSPQAYTTMFFSIIVAWLGFALKNQKPNILK